MKVGLATISHLFVFVVEFGIILMLISFFLPFVQTRDIDSQEHTVSYYSSHLTSFCIDVNAEFTKHTCVYYSGNSAFFKNLPHFSPKSGLYLGVTTLTSFALIFAVVFLIIEVYGFFNAESCQTGVVKNLSACYDFISGYLNFLPSIEEHFVSLIHGVTFSVIISVFNGIALLLAIIAISNTNFDDENELNIPSKSVCAGFFVYLIGFILIEGGVIGTTLSRFFAGRIQDSSIPNEPNPAFDGVPQE